MKNIYFKAILMLLLVMPVFGEIKDYKAEYNIYSSNILVELNILLEEKRNSFEVEIPKDAEAVEVKDLKFDIIELENKNRIMINDSPFNFVNIKYITSSFIERSSGDTFFILDLSDLESIEKEVTVKLPEKAVLKHSLESLEQSIIPKTNNVLTDGKRIIIKWNENNLKEANSVLIIYKTSNQYLTLFWISLIFILLLFVIFFNKYLKSRVHIKKTENEFTRNLFDEEKKIVSILMGEKNNELWQKQLELKSSISKVRLSRKLRNLEEKGIIEKIPYGNTNKIRLKKG